MPRQPREFDRSLHRLGAAIRKEGAIESRKLAQPLRQLPLVLVVVEIRKVNGPPRLLPNGLNDARMSVSQSIHTQPGDEVQILFALKVEKENTFAPLKGNWVPIVCGKEIASLKFSDLIEAGHTSIVKLPTLLRPTRM